MYLTCRAFVDPRLRIPVLSLSPHFLWVIGAVYKTWARTLVISMSALIAKHWKQEQSHSKGRRKTPGPHTLRTRSAKLLSAPSTWGLSKRKGGKHLSEFGEWSGFPVLYAALWVRSSNTVCLASVRDFVSKCLYIRSYGFPTNRIAFWKHPLGAQGCAVIWLVAPPGEWLLVVGAKLTATLSGPVPRNPLFPRNKFMLALSWKTQHNSVLSWKSLE